MSEKKITSIIRIAQKFTVLVSKAHAVARRHISKLFFTKASNAKTSEKKTVYSSYLAHSGTCPSSEEDTIPDEDAYCAQFRCSMKLCVLVVFFDTKISTKQNNKSNRHYKRIKQNMHKGRSLFYHIGIIRSSKLSGIVQTSNNFQSLYNCCI